MQWLKDFVNHNPKFAVAIPTILSAMNFGGKLLIAMSDGIITDDEFHSLTSSANGIEVFILMLVMYAIKKKEP